TAHPATDPAPAATAPAFGDARSAAPLALASAAGAVPRARRDEAPEPAPAPLLRRRGAAGRGAALPGAGGPGDGAVLPDRTAAGSAAEPGCRAVAASLRGGEPAGARPRAGRGFAHGNGARR